MVSGRANYIFGFLVLVMLGLSVYVFYFLPGPERTRAEPEKVRVVASDLSAERLKQLRLEYTHTIQPDITQIQKNLERLIQQYRKVIRDAERTGDMFATYHNLGVIQEQARAFEAYVFLPDHLPDDVRETIEGAMSNYKDAADAIKLACAELRNAIDGGGFRSAEMALGFTQSAESSRTDGDVKILLAKRLLGFK